MVVSNLMEVSLAFMQAPLETLTFQTAISAVRKQKKAANSHNFKHKSIMEQLQKWKP